MLEIAKLTLEVALVCSMVGSIYPKQAKDIKSSVINNSSFLTTINVKQDDNLATTDFSKIFGDNPTDENANNTKTATFKHKNLNLRILPLDDDNIIILKIGDKAILIGTGKEKNLNKLLENLGNMNITSLEAIVFNNILDDTKNLYTLLEMNMTKKVLLPSPNTEKNIDNYHIYDKLEEIKLKANELHAEIFGLKNNTNINFEGYNITSYIPKNTYAASLLLNYNEDYFFIAEEMPKNAQKELTLPKVFAYITNSKVIPEYSLLQKIMPKKIIITNKENGVPESTLTLLKRFVEDDSLFKISNSVGVDFNKNADTMKEIAKGNNNNN